jgi:predicted MFS family arabinose efflux permease
MTPLRTFALLTCVQFTQYIVLTVNYRAIAHERYAIAGGTAGVASVLAYAIVRRIVRDDSRWALAGMVVGGSLADMAGIWVTRAWS